MMHQYSNSCTPPLVAISIYVTVATTQIFNINIYYTYGTAQFKLDNDRHVVLELLNKSVRLLASFSKRMIQHHNSILDQHK